MPVYGSRNRRDILRLIFFLNFSSGIITVTKNTEIKNFICNFSTQKYLYEYNKIFANSVITF